MALSVEENEIDPRRAGHAVRRNDAPLLASRSASAAELKGGRFAAACWAKIWWSSAMIRAESGLLALRCLHRGTSLEFGHIEDGGLRCCYHGWLYDVEGKILQMPGEPADSTFKDRIRQQAYKAQEAAGIIFAYIGPEPAPLLPRWDVLDPRRRRTLLGRAVDSLQFLQTVENSVDQHHFKWLHRTPKTRALDRRETDFRSHRVRHPRYFHPHRARRLVHDRQPFS